MNNYYSHPFRKAEIKGAFLLATHFIKFCNAKDVIVYHTAVLCMILKTQKGFLQNGTINAYVQKARISSDSCVVNSHWIALMVKIVL